VAVKKMKREEIYCLKIIMYETIILANVKRERPLSMKKMTIIEASV